MKTPYVMVTAVAMSAALAGSAGAVDIWDAGSGDGPGRAGTLTILESGQERHITLMKGAMLRNICSDCTIKVEDGDTVHASKNDMVEVRGTALTVRHVTGAHASAQPATQAARRPDTAKTMTPMGADGNARPADGRVNDAMGDPVDGLEGGN